MATVDFTHRHRHRHGHGHRHTIAELHAHTRARSRMNNLIEAHSIEREMMSTFCLSLFISLYQAAVMYLSGLPAKRAMATQRPRYKNNNNKFSLGCFASWHWMLIASYFIFTRHTRFIQNLLFSITFACVCKMECICCPCWWILSVANFELPDIVAIYQPSLFFSLRLSLGYTK